MQVMVDLCVVPLGVGLSLSKEIAVCQRVIADAGLAAQLHPYGTVIEGEWDAVMACVKACHEALHDAGVPRVFTTLKLGTRTDKIQHMEDKVASVRALLQDAP
ncbi:MAG: MTH1187 family thiamine-binding protein [Gammaproteobacteria bacterium]|nr:MTH1187 family thiamine-binding protein [Gammaproteobacteria bacterium]